MFPAHDGPMLIQHNEWKEYATYGGKTLEEFIIETADDHGWTDDTQRQKALESGEVWSLSWHQGSVQKEIFAESFEALTAYFS